MSTAPRQPAAPISKAMREGKEPLRTFGDLKQFFASKQGDETPEAVPESAVAPEQPVSPASPSPVEHGAGARAQEPPADSPEGQHEGQAGGQSAEQSGSPPQPEAGPAG